MRNSIMALSFAALTAAAIAVPTVSNAETVYGRDSTVAYGAPVAGAVVGTAVGVGLYNGWYGSAPTIGSTLLPTTAAGAVAVGGVAGIGTVALIDSAVQPCRGFHALFGANKDSCVNGEYVGDGPRRYVR